MNVLIAAAGTGGHINPAIAIANIILKNDKDAEILFVGTKNGLENKLVENAGFNIKHIRTGKIIRSFTFKNINQMYLAYKGIADSCKVIDEFEPDLVIGTGGYVCVPVMIAARRKKIPYILHESNAFPGVSVKLLAKKAARVMISFKEAKDRLKYKENVVYTGTPAKFSVNDYDRLDKDECKKKFELDKINKKIILVTCGSQGAKKINEVVLDMVKNIHSDKYYIVLVTGDKNFDEINEKLNKIKEETSLDIKNYIKLERFIFNMDELYKSVDMCITRSGAMTITELSIVAKPSILIPLPTAAENHQYYNAKVLEDVGAARIIEQKNLDYNVLNKNISEMLDENKLEKMSQMARKKVSYDIEDKIYDVIEKVVKKK